VLVCVSIWCNVPVSSGIALARAVEFIERQAVTKEDIAIMMPLGDKGDLIKNGLQDWYAEWITKVPLLEVFDLMEVRS
jgi:hypothetical protein